jgi:hypothetical protein
MRANETLVGDRYPVLAVGSNACPAQLVHKMEGAGVSSTIPMAKATVTGVDVGVSAYVSPLGYISSSPVAAPGHTRELFVTWLDASQLEIVDRSEGIFDPAGEYDRVLLPAPDVRVELASGEVLGEVYAYVHRYGVLCDAEGNPRRHLGERQLLADVLAESRQLREWFGDTPEEFSSRARGNLSLCGKGTRLFADENRTTRSGLEHHVPDRPANAVYDDLHPYGDLDEDTYRVGRTPDAFDQREAGVVRISAALSRRLGDPRVVIVQNDRLPHARHARLGALAGVVVADDIDADDTRLVQVDNSLRVGIGVDPGETVTLTPAVLPQQPSWWQRMLFDRHNYVLCRVQDGDRASAEHEVCLLDHLTLELLGVASGDAVVLEGFPGPDGVVPTLRLKAIETSEEVTERRKELHGGTMNSRYPSSIDALGVFPDLPWVFLDRRLWAGLGMAGQWMGTVRIRCSRSYQLKKELRELVFLLGLAFIGVVTVLESLVFQGVSLAVVILLVGVVVNIRLRARLQQRAQPVRSRSRRRRR